jgi:hypothetical protein
MYLLELAQANFIATINDGPDALDRDLFAGPLDRVMLGLKAHANTINHARLVALEETFPMTREAMGDAQFNQLSRAYVETEKARASDNNLLGKHFAEHLQTSEVEAALCDLADIEWAWLKSYNAADARALDLADIAGLAETALLMLPVACHPAAQIVALTAPLSDQLSDIAAIMPQPAAILAVRPEAEVRLLPIDAETALTFKAAQKNSTIGNLLALAAEQAGMADPSGPLMTLLGAGALVEAGYAGNHSSL